MNECELKEEIKNLSKKFKETKNDTLVEYLDYILKDKYENCNNLRLYNTIEKTKKIYSDFIGKYNLDNLLDDVIFESHLYRFKQTGITDVDSNKKVVIIPENNTKDLFNLVRYTIILDQMNKGNDEIVSYIKAMLVEKKLLDYLISIDYSKIECEKIKKYNLMEVIYISNILNCTIDEIKFYNQVLEVNDNIINETEKNIKKHIDISELNKYDLTNSKKYIYGIIYSTFLHQNLNDEEIIKLLNTSLKFSDFVDIYIKNVDREKIFDYYNKEYRC